MVDVEVAKRLVQTQENAKSRGIEFSLSFTKLKRLMNQKRCYYTNVAFVRDKGRHDDSMTLDRLDNDKGYIDSNVVACTHRINTLKSNLSLKEIELMFKKTKDI